MKLLDKFFDRLGFPVLEGRVVTIALALAVAHLGLVAWAAIGLNINVPTCLADDPKSLEPAFEEIGENRYQLYVVAEMWQFRPGKIKIPVGSTLDIFLSSKDVIHGFFIKDTTVNLMAIPGTVGNEQAYFDKMGTYPIICHEYCGSGHQFMLGEIEVVAATEEASAEGLNQAAPENTEGGEGAGGNDILTQGRALATQKGCLACHSDNGMKLVGPTFKGIWERQEKLADGTEIVVDEAYLRESITAPNNKIVEGYLPNLMPPLPLTDEEVDLLVEFLKTFSQ